MSSLPSAVSSVPTGPQGTLPGLVHNACPLVTEAGPSMASACAKVDCRNYMPSPSWCCAPVIPAHGRETEAGAPGQPGGHISLEEDRERGCWAPSPRNFLCVLPRLTEENNSKALCTDGLGVGLSPLLEPGPWMSQSLRTCFLHSRGGAVRIK